MRFRLGSRLNFGSLIVLSLLFACCLLFHLLEICIAQVGFSWYGNRILLEFKLQLLYASFKPYILVLLFLKQELQFLHGQFFIYFGLVLDLFGPGTEFECGYCFI